MTHSWLFVVAWFAVWSVEFILMSLAFHWLARKAGSRDAGHVEDEYSADDAEAYIRATQVTPPEEK